MAARFLQSRGCKLLYRNFRAPKGGEVDLVLRGGENLDLLVFVEVKTRTRRDFGRLLRAVNVEKQALIVRGTIGMVAAFGAGIRSGSQAGRPKSEFLALRCR